MTRLITDWIADIEKDIEECECYLKEKTGLDFVSLSAKAAGQPEGEFRKYAGAAKVAVVPVTSGQGVIGSFCESVAAIVRVMGAHSFVTEKTDVDGMFEAACKGAEVIYLADDNRFIAINCKTGKIGENDFSTALGYVTALEYAINGLKEKEILLLGYGKVGMEIQRSLTVKGANVTVYDRSSEKQRALSDAGIKIIRDPMEIKSYKYIIDATSEGGWIKKEMLHEDVWYVSPGVPVSLDDAAYQHCTGRMIHDCLQIGVAAMLGFTYSFEKLSKI